MEDESHNPPTPYGTMVTPHNMMTAKEKRHELIEIVKNEGIVIKDILLSSGKRSSYYYDMKKVVGNARALFLIADLMIDEIIKPNFPDFRSIGGLEIGSIPLSTAIIMMHPERKRGFISQFIVRKNPKQHGLEKKIEGRLEEPIVIVDDVFTSGKSIQRAIDAVRHENLNIEGVICVLDRQEEEGEEGTQQNDFKKAWGRRYHSLLRHADFKDYINEKLKQS